MCLFLLLWVVVSVWARRVQDEVSAAEAEDKDSHEYLTHASPTHCGEQFSVFPYVEADEWGSVREDWKDCGGSRQSPLSFGAGWTGVRSLASPRRSRGKSNATRSAAVDQVETLSTHYEKKDRAQHLINNGHALEVEGHFGSIMVDGAVFESKQFHFHVPAEHGFSDNAVAEMHIVHVSDGVHWDGYFGDDFRAGKKGEIAVVGILFKIGEANACLAEVLSDPLPDPGCGRKIPSIDLAECFKTELAGNWMSYVGSLTTPPCTEGVHWSIMENWATISQQQFDRLMSLLEHNARPPQARNSREIKYHRGAAPS